MKILDYLLQTGEKQGNSKHFQNFLKIHGGVMKLETEVDELRWMIEVKEKELISRGSKLISLRSEVSRLKNDNSSLEMGLIALEESNEAIMKQVEESFKYHTKMNHLQEYINNIPDAAVRSQIISILEEKN